jgi:transcriptional regulator with XRE-family HTH domain
MITVRQVKAARALLDWSREDLAESAGISYRTITRLERIDGPLRGSRESRDAIRAALESTGIKFIAAGVQLKSSR